MPQVSLRTLLWILFAAAIASGWGWERWTFLAQIDEAEKKSPFSLAKNTGGPSPWSLERHAALDRLAKLSDQEVVEQRDARQPGGGILEYGVWLTEVARRKLVDVLRAEFDRYAKLPHGPRDNAQLYTILRRAEGKPDPVRIEVKFTKEGNEGWRLSLAHVEGIVRNSDVDRETIVIPVGSDYRGGRLERWRIELRNEQGVRMPDSNFMSIIGGGLGTDREVKFGETTDWRCLMDPRRYIAPPPTGRYQLQLIHSDQYGDIANEPDLTGVVVWKSEPVWVEVVNRENQLIDTTLIRLILVIGLAIAVLIVFRAWSAARSEEETWFARWGDVASCALLIGLAIGWWLDVRQLNHHLSRLRPDKDADWEIVEPRGDDAKEV